jgi:hypothetical protein
LVDLDQDKFGQTDERVSVADPYDWINIAGLISIAVAVVAVTTVLVL